MKSKKDTSPQQKPTVGRPKDISKREDIIRAAYSLFLKKGYELTSVEAVAKKADVSKLTIYSHFSGKDELFTEAIGQRCKKALNSFDFSELADKPVEEALFKFAVNYNMMIFTKDTIRLHSIIQAEAQRHPKVVKLFFENVPKMVRESFGQLLTIWHGQGKVNIPNTSIATDQFFSLLKGELLTRVMLLRDPIPNEEELKAHANATIRLFMDGYGPKTR